MTESGGGFDENGFPIPSTSSMEFLTDCRDSPSGGGSVINTAQGESVKYGSVIYTPKGLEPIPENTLLEVRNEDGTVRLKANVIRFAKEQAHCRIWV